MSNIRPEEFDLCRQMKDIIVAAAAKHDWAPEILAGIISRESRFGLILDENMCGDGGHGHGLTQIDDRSFGAWLAANDWTDPATNIEMGAKVLTGKYNFLNGQGLFDGLTDTDANRAAIAAYNCGEGNEGKVLREGDDLDARTANHNYSADVMARATEFKEIFA